MRARIQKNDQTQKKRTTRKPALRTEKGLLTTPCRFCTRENMHTPTTYKRILLHNHLNRDLLSQQFTFLISCGGEWRPTRSVSPYKAKRLDEPQPSRGNHLLVTKQTNKEKMSLNPGSAVPRDESHRGGIATNRSGRMTPIVLQEADEPREARNVSTFNRRTRWREKQRKIISSNNTLNNKNKKSSLPKNQ